MLRRLYQRLGLALALALAGLALPGPPTIAPAQAADAYAGWHLPVPAGEWTISRGPCGAESFFDHECGYYENACAVDLVPRAGSMENVPVLAPYTGQVFFSGQRSETGLMLMLLHPDGRVSALMHLAKIVVSLDESVDAGQVVAYAGHSGTARAHLHFFIQPNAVERACDSPLGLDTLDFRRGQAVSRNLGWTELTLVDPPLALPDWLPTLGDSPSTGLGTPLGVKLAPGTAVSVPVLAPGRLTETDTLALGGRRLSPARRAPDYALFRVPLVAALTAGDYQQTLETQAAGRRLTGVLRYTVRPAPVSGSPPDVLLENAELLGPAGWSRHAASPRLCWRVPEALARRGAGVESRVLVSGPTLADSGWIQATCWQPPPLQPGTYFWKPFLRGQLGAMNRSNQRPFAFVIRR